MPLTDVCKPMRKIIQVFGSLNAGGAESRMLDVYRAIDRTKYRFIFVTLDTSENQFYEKEINSLGGEIIKIPSPRQVGVIRHFRELYTLFTKLPEKGECVIHSHTSYHSGIVLAAAKAAGIRIRIAHARTTNTVNRNTLAQKAMVAAGKILLRFFASYRMALNPETAIALFGKKKYEQGKVLIIKNAIPLERFKNPKVCADLSFLPTDSIVIGHIGRFEPMKNHRFIIDFFETFLKNEPKAHLVLVGDGQLRDNIETLVREKGLDESVHFMGLRRDIPSVLRHFNLFIFPSFFEGLGGSVLEAQASGVPCVISDTIPANVDMGLGLIRRVGLERPMSQWVEACNRQISVPRPDYDTIYKAFNNAGFTLEKELAQLTSVYENAYDNHYDIQ